MKNADSRLGPNVAGVVAMLLVAPLIVGLVVAMNRLTEPREENDRNTGVDIVVEHRKTKPPPAPDKPPPPPRRRRAPSAERMAISRLPSLSTALTGVDLNLPELRFDQISAVSDSVLGDLDKVIHTESTVDRKPVAVVKTPIEPPEVARRKNLSGRVVVNILIGSDGAVKAVKIIESNPVFDDCVVRAVQSWVFEPAVYKGQTVEMWASLPVHFSP